MRLQSGAAAVPTDPSRAPIMPHPAKDRAALVSRQQLKSPDKPEARRPWTKKGERHPLQTTCPQQQLSRMLDSLCNARAGGAGGGKGPTWGSLRDFSYQMEPSAYLDHGDPNYDPEEHALVIEASSWC